MNISFARGTEPGTRSFKDQWKRQPILSIYQNFAIPTLVPPPYPPLSAEARTTSVCVHGPASMRDTRVCVACQLVNTFVSILHDIAQINDRQRHLSRRLRFV